VAPSRAAEERLCELGLPAGRADVLHNFLSGDGFADATAAARGEYALVVGRLVEEKGIDVAIEAAARAEVPLVIAGSGPDMGRLRLLARKLDSSVRFPGRLGPEEMDGVRRRAAFAVAPSRWDEPCPYSVIEAMAAGRPVLASDAGGLPEIVGGETLAPRAVDDWAEAMRELWRDPSSRATRGAAALERARDLYGPERAYDGLMRIYGHAG
jgi:glycosyltransferase involved in cell wall biosynthesis